MLYPASRREVPTDTHSSQQGPELIPTNPPRLVDAQPTCRMFGLASQEAKSNNCSQKAKIFSLLDI